MGILGACNLSLAELIAILLNTGSAKQSVLDLANDISKIDLRQLISVDEKKLLSYSGVGKSKAATLLAAFEIAKRYKDYFEPIILNKPSKLFYQAFEIKDRKQEVCMAFYLNGSQQLLHKKILAIGSLNQNFLEFRELLEPAITLPAAGIILAHNHPSGDCQPSRQDLEVTKQVAHGCKLMGIELIDHIVVSRNNYLSLKQEGLME